jgi:hypothetical protein
MSTNNNEEIINTITNLDLDLVCCAGCNKKQKSDEFEEDINGDMWCADCYASLKDKFKKSYKCDADTEDDDDGFCERCGEYHCEEDTEHGNRELWASNIDGKNICRRCVREEDELEDEETRLCEECGREWNVEQMVETDDRKFYCRKCKKREDEEKTMDK